MIPPRAADSGRKKALPLLSPVFQTHHGQIVELLRVLYKAVDGFADVQKDLLRRGLRVFVQGQEHPFFAEHAVFGVCRLRQAVGVHEKL